MTAPRLRPVLAALAAGVLIAPAARPAATSAPEAASVATWPLPRLGVPRAAGDGVVWAFAPLPRSDDLALWRAALEPPTATDSSRLAAWKALSHQTRWRPYALRHAASLALAAGDSAAADSLLAALAPLPGIWQWPALAQRAALALARGDSAGALARLEHAPGDDWPAEEIAPAQALRAQLLAATGDTSAALALARATIARFPALPAVARLLPRVEAWRSARREPPSAADERAAAEVLALVPDRAAAAERLERAARLLPAGERAAVERRAGEMLRGARQFGDAGRLLARAARDAPDDAERARVELEHARVERDAGQPAAAEHHYGRAAALAPDAGLRELALWERGREVEQRGDWKRARADYARVATLGLGRAAEAALRAGLLWYVEGEGDSARASWGRSGSEAGAFWAAVSRRARERTAADSALALIAARPGYSFYRAAARDTLGVRGRPPIVAPAPAPDSGDPTLALARDLVTLGEGDDAAALLQRWYAGDARLPAHGRSLPRRPGALLEAARLAYAAGRPALGIQIARRAVDSVPESSVVERWSLVPWAYPPAYDSLVAAAVGAADSTALDPNLVLALIWQESKFDAGARSRSNALGLMQLKTGVAATLARRRGERPPGERGLLDPAVNVRLGTRLLAELARPFGRQVSLILAAYNAGPGSAARWRRPEVVGGDALEAELFEYAETQDYVKSILAVRQAYREWRPRSGRPGAAADDGPPPRAGGSAP